ncbi:hypothetical protein KIPB_005270, partial [Kipferlia bialata]
RYPRGK